MRGCLGCNACRFEKPCIQKDAFNDRGMLLAGGCGSTNGKPQIDKTSHLEEAYRFGKNIYSEQA